MRAYITLVSYLCRCYIIIVQCESMTVSINIILTYKEETIMTIRETGLCNGIIHSASAVAAAVGGGLAQVPASDNLIITPIPYCPNPFLLILK